jgi:protein phosphatase
VYCFRCNRNLEDVSVINGIDGTGDLIDGALRFIRERGHNILEPSRVRRLRDARTKTLPENLNGEPLTCLRCGTFNQPTAKRCALCEAPLMVADDDGLLMQPSARTSVGQVRTNNEDSVALWAIDGLLVALVADGMGGAAAGEEASRLAVESVQANFLGDAQRSERLQMLGEDDLMSWLRDAVLNANEAVVERAQRDSSRRGMGTTSTLAVVRTGRVFIAHVGDSRAYLIDKHDRSITQLTDDHSFVQALVASGHITTEQARYHPMGHVLYRALGQSLDLEVDLYKHSVRLGDRLVICSDGLTRHLAPREIGEIVLRTENPTEASLDLIELANARGGEDNVSVAVIQIDNAEVGAAAAGA